MLRFGMRIFNHSAVMFYGRRHADVRDDLLAWYAEAEKAVWKTPAEVRRQFPHASALPNHRIVFNLGGNRYRLIVSFNYSCGTCFIKFFGTHAQYDRIDALTVDHTGVIHGKTTSRD